MIRNTNPIGLEITTQRSSGKQKKTTERITLIHIWTIQSTQHKLWRDHHKQCIYMWITDILTTLFICCFSYFNCTCCAHSKNISRVYDCDLDLILICLWEDSMKIFLTTNQDSAVDQTCNVFLVTCTCLAAMEVPLQLVVAADIL